MRHLGIRRAHLVGHSSGGHIILQLALDAPDRVGSLAVLEPALPVAESGSKRLLSTRAFMAPVLERYRAGDRAGAVDGFMRGVTGPDYRIALDRVLPGAYESAVASADTFFGQELPALKAWSFRREDARRIVQPVLAVIGRGRVEAGERGFDPGERLGPALLQRGDFWPATLRGSRARPGRRSSSWTPPLSWTTDPEWSGSISAQPDAAASATAAKIARFTWVPAMCLISMPP
jgi:acetyl esterase/lipase